MGRAFFIAKRIYFSGGGKRQAAGPAVRIAMTGVALGLAVMIVSLCVVAGFKGEVRSKVIGLGAHIQASNFRNSRSYETLPVAADDSLLAAWERIEGVEHAQRYATKPGMIKTDEHFQGMVLKGVGQEYDMAFLRSHLVEGEIPAFTDSAASNRVLVSRSLADRLHIRLGDALLTYYIQENVRARKLKVAGIYETHFSDFDNLFVIGDLYTAARLNGWERNQASGVEIRVAEGSGIEETAWRVAQSVEGRSDRYGNSYYVQTVEELNPQLFAWLGVLDLNVWVILILMTGVAGFSMISGLLIIILERTGMIGILKALGETNRSIRKIFLWFAAFVIGKGMAWGNVIGLALCFVQSRWHLVRLDPANYYIDAVPVSFNGWVWIALNLSTWIVSLLILIGPSCLISRIHPAKSIRFE